MAEMRLLDAKRSPRLAGVVPLEPTDIGIFVSMDDLLVWMDEMAVILDEADVAFTKPSQVIEAVRIHVRTLALDTAGITGERADPA